MDLSKTALGQKLAVTSSDGCHYLVGVSGTMSGRRIEIVQGSLTVGRLAGVDLQIKDQSVSGEHCRIDLVPNVGLVVNDLGSSNGTFMNQERITEPRIFPIGSFLQLGDSLFKHEFRSRQEVIEEQRLAGDLQKAASYVRSLLPPPISEGVVRTEWRFVPSAKLGGDAFGYHWIDDQHFALYLIDVCGHGTAPALHSVSVINVVRKMSLPHVDFHQPDQVLSALNANFQMSEHADLYFTAWYGVYAPASRTLAFASGGHPPAFLFGPELGEGQKLMTRNFAPGMLPDAEFSADQVEVPAGGRLYVYSDGAYEIVTSDGGAWRVDDFYNLLTTTPPTDSGEPERVEQAVRAVMVDAEFEDDFSLLLTWFP